MVTVKQNNVRKFGKLREKIKGAFNTQKIFADALNMNVATLNQKLNGKADWTLAEMESACVLLDIPLDEVNDYFFY